MEIDPVGLINIPAAYAMHHVAELLLVLARGVLPLLADYVLGELHRIRAVTLAVADHQLCSGQKYRIRLQKSVLYTLLRTLELQIHGLILLI